MGAPPIDLERWLVIEVPDGLALRRHFLGCRGPGKWRISTAIVEETSEWARTESGRIYRKDGERITTLDEEALIALARLLMSWGIDRVSIAGILELATTTAL